jgi:hypothetical protein
MTRTLSDERKLLKQQALELSQLNWSEREIAMELGIPRGTIHHWLSSGSYSIVEENATKAKSDIELVDYCGSLQNDVVEGAYPLYFYQGSWRHVF